MVTVEAGVSPYAFEPSDDALAGWHDSEIYQRLNSPTYYSVYPPVSQLLFSASALAYGSLGWTGSWYLLKLILVVLEVVAIALLCMCARPRLVALYALNPLVVLEVAGQGHTEGLVVFGVAMFVWGLGSSQTAMGAGAVVATFAKLAPAPLAVVAVRRGGIRALASIVALSFAAGIWFWTPTALAHAGASLGLFVGTLDQYALPYRALKAALYPAVGDAAGRIASVSLVGLWSAAVVSVIVVDDRSVRMATNALVVIIVGAALVTSTLHPWYFVPVLFVTPLVRRPPVRWALIWLAGLSSVTYLEYVLDGVELAALALGWGGALAVYLASGHGGDGFEDAVGCRHARVHPDPRRVAPEPGQLPLRVPPRVALDEAHAVLEGAVPIEDGKQLLVPDGLREHGGSGGSSEPRHLD